MLNKKLIDEWNVIKKNKNDEQWCLGGDTLQIIVHDGHQIPSDWPMVQWIWVFQTHPSTTASGYMLPNMNGHREKSNISLDRIKRALPFIFFVYKCKSIFISPYGLAAFVKVNIVNRMFAACLPACFRLHI